MDKKLKILAFSDTHGDQTLLKDLQQRAKDEDVDLVVICGDFTGLGEEIPKGLIQPFLELGKRVLILNGNHESNSTADFVAERYKIWNLHGKGVRYKDVGIFGCGGANIGPFFLDEQGISEELSKGHASVAYLGKKIMATHVHPARGKVEQHFFPGSDAVRQAITKFKPDVLICGHIHEAEGMEEIIENTRVINVKKGKIIEL